MYKIIDHYTYKYIYICGLYRYSNSMVLVQKLHRMTNKLSTVHLSPYVKYPISQIRIFPLTVA